MSDAEDYFQWTGIDKKGKRVSGKLYATEIKSAQIELKKNGFDVISIKKIRQIKLGTFSKNKIKHKDIVLFTRLLSTMIAAGLPIMQAIELIARDQANTTMKSLLMQIRSNVSGGKSLTEAFRKHPQYFSNFYCSLLQAGETSGTLDKVLDRLAIYLEKSETIRKKIKKALVYPVVIIIVSMIVSAILLIFVVPQFQSIFSSFGAKLPYFTQLVVDLSQFVRAYWWLVLGAIIAGIFGLRYELSHRESLAEKASQIMLKLPIVGILIQKGILARFTRTLAITLDSGMPIVDTMKSMVDVVDNRIYKKGILEICNSLINGQQLNVAMEATKLFPNMTIQMIAVGESSGNLSVMLNKIAEYYEEDVNNIVDNLSNLLEPLIMIILGIVIGSFVIAMYLPIFKIGSIVK